MSRTLFEQVNAQIRNHAAEMRRIQRSVSEAMGELNVLRDLAQRRRSITEEIDKIPGRRIYYNLNGVQTFGDAQEGRRGEPVSFLVSQDGPFVQTHYPLVLWRPSAPANAVNLGFWRPVAAAWPLPSQVVEADLVSISWEVVDAGSQRNFQNLPTPPLLSRPDNAVPLPVPTLFTPNTTIQFFPTYHRILFNGDPAPTEGRLEVQLPGYRIVNM